MKPAVLRLLITAALFVLWIGYLAYLWLDSLSFRPAPPGTPSAAREPLVLSQPQFQASPLVVVARVDHVWGGALAALPSPVVVEEVLKDAKGAIQKDQILPVAGIAESHRRDSELPDFTGPGSYLLALSPREDGAYEVTPIPPSPGFPSSGGPRRIYPATPTALAQFRALPR
jgi:hypothetical protein